ncbi:MAG: hypothetical protein IJ867_00435 [Clostridia bacterium]|nr:hypothetical protein [Clostridia bacterium]
MKRLITFICLIVIIFVGYKMVEKGFDNDTFNIASYEVIETKSEALTKKLALYDKKNQDEYGTAVNNLNSSIRSYNTSKEKYETILAELEDILNSGDDEEVAEVIEEIIYSDKEKYKVDFLLVVLGRLGEKNGVDVIYRLTTSSTTDPNSTTLGYFLADLEFTVTGAYMDVATFISDLENDDRLSWEIKNFAMASGNSNGYSGVTATFTIKDVPIDSESFISSSLSSPSTTDTQTENPVDDGAATTNDGTTPSDATNETTNTTSNETASQANTNTTANTTNTVTNNTVTQ